MKDLIVNSLELLSKIAIILTVVIGFLTGMTTGHFWNAIAGAAIAFMISVVIFGIIFLLLDINDNLRAIRRTLGSVENYAAGKPPDWIPGDS